MKMIKAKLKINNYDSIFKSWMQFRYLYDKKDHFILLALTQVDICGQMIYHLNFIKLNKINWFKIFSSF